VDEFEDDNDWPFVSSRNYEEQLECYNRANPVIDDNVGKSLTKAEVRELEKKTPLGAIIVFPEVRN
jgi:hypothetical protein